MRSTAYFCGIYYCPLQGYGFAEVEQLYGLETIRNAADQLKKLYGGKGKMRLKLFISIKGIKLFEYNTMVRVFNHFEPMRCRRKLVPFQGKLQRLSRHEVNSPPKLFPDLF